MDQVRLQFLGSGDAFGSGGRFQTCLYLSGSSEPVLFDHEHAQLAEPGGIPVSYYNALNVARPNYFGFFFPPPE